jgi:hypothetical protein
MIKDTKVKKSRTDLTRQLLDMKMDTKIGFWMEGHKPMSNELKPEKKIWAEVKAFAANRTRWRIFTRALCSTKE